ncbi:Disease resistance RPP13-like protein 4 [Vitis vinifera]|uniref:Disease resistance RPP13-like protein 4 n=1 Tax=Vitis vinifera TaxID=29760 RepID=A0A438BXN6_VITVI|nr:Disease resistance RPP13-like protein 4 [Vitis vinifera]
MAGVNYSTWKINVSCETQSPPSVSGESQAPCEVGKISTSSSKYKEDYSLPMAEGMHIHQTPSKDNGGSLLKHRANTSNCLIINKMSADHLQFLKNKFILDLEDAEEEHSGENEIPLLAHFLQIRDALKAKDITPSTPIRLKNCLYNAISALEECVVSSEKREPRKKKDGPMHGYTLAEHWLLCKTRRLLVQISRRLTATADAVIPGMTDMAVSSSSASLPLIPRPNPENFYPNHFRSFYGQRNEIMDRLDFGKGFQEIGIVGIGGSGKTTLAQLVFTQSDERYFQDNRIWICLFPKLSGDVDLKEMIKDMLKQCGAAAVVDDGVEVEVEELLENLGKALKGKRYLMVLDGIWDINIHWYFKLKEKLKSLPGDGDGHVIITSRLPHKARMMVGSHNLYHMQPPSTPMELIWEFYVIMGMLKNYKLKLKDEVIEQCDGGPLAMHTMGAVIGNQILGVR